MVHNGSPLCNASGRSPATHPDTESKPLSTDLATELAGEQQVLDIVYTRLDTLRAETGRRLDDVRREGPSGSPQNRSERDSFATLYEDRLAQLEAVEERLAFGRLDLVDAVSVPTDFSDAQGASATRALLSSPHRPTALIFDSDVMAVAGLAVAAEMGVAVPAGLSVVSFEDSLLTRIVHPSITALSRDTFALGGQVAARLLAAIDEPGSVQNVQSATPRLTVRESTRAPYTERGV